MAKRIRISTFFRNLYSLMKYDLHKADNENQKAITNFSYLQHQKYEELYYDIKDKYDLLRLELLKEKIVRYYYTQGASDCEKYKDELDYLEHHAFSIFPYEKLKSIETITCELDTELLMNYVLHEGKRLYFPKTWHKGRCTSVYLGYIEDENLLGGNYRKKSPHQYESETIKVEKGDVLVDVGCAEALFTLHHINDISKAYLVEVDTEWKNPLEATFSPYKEKVEIINKLISNVDSKDSITLKTLLEKDRSNSVYVKMDIEGYETSVIESSMPFLNSFFSVKMACCTYHKAYDAEKLERILTDCGFSVEYSDGYMLFPMDRGLEIPYFRKGLIRAKK